MVRETQARAGAQRHQMRAGRARARTAARDEQGRFITRIVIVASAAIFSVALTTCQSHKPETHYTLLEVIDVKGTCHEDHVNQSDSYAGQIVRWRNDSTKQISTYGSVTNTGDLVRRTIEGVKHPTKYQTPFSIEFMDIQFETNLPKWELHGTSWREEGGPGYDTTCELVVVKRGKELKEK
jgi:hypothetical protein